MRVWVEFLATGFYVGRWAPFAPGTFGTLLALPLFYGLSFAPLGLWAAAVVLMSVFAVLICRYQEQNSLQHDPKSVVIDEVAGYLVATWALPWNLPVVIASFALFRLIDALKPGPIKWVDRKVKGGFGTVADDLLAGLAANFILQMGLWILR